MNTKKTVPIRFADDYFLGADAMPSLSQKEISMLEGKLKAEEKIREQAKKVDKAYASEVSRYL